MDLSLIAKIQQARQDDRISVSNYKRLVYDCQNNTSDKIELVYAIMPNGQILPKTNCYERIISIKIDKTTGEIKGDANFKRLNDRARKNLGDTLYAFKNEYLDNITKNKKRIDGLIHDIYIASNKIIKNNYKALIKLAPKKNESSVIVSEICINKKNGEFVMKSKDFIRLYLSRNEKCAKIDRQKLGRVKNISPLATFNLEKSIEKFNKVYGYLIEREARR